MSNDQHAGKCELRTGGKLGWAFLLAAACVTVLAGPANPPPAAANAAPAAAALFAKVGDIVVNHQEFDAAFAQAARAKFYHGKAPENAIAMLQREVGQAMVDEILLVAEAKRRNLQPDPAAIKKTIDEYEQRYATSEQWKSNRDRVLPGLKAKLERDNILAELSKQVKNVGAPTPLQLQQYWETHEDKFTSPEQVHLAMILLKVDPSSPQAQWDGALAEGAAIVKRLQAGADFGELAHLHSGDSSAQRGGDMGYVHRGMLPDAAQQAVDKLKPGELSDAVVVLEGVAVFRLADRKPPKLNPLDAVRERATELWMRDKGEEAWTALVAKLRRDTPVKLDDSRFLPLTTTSGGNAAPQ
jgi:parvulin-like peptidyl-prolyl isomerase